MKIESPIYRFEKYDKNWLFVKISDLASQFKTGGTPSTKEPTFWGGSIPWIQSSDIQKDILFGVIPQKFISEEGLQNSSAKLIPKNSIAIVTRVGVGKLAIIDQDYATSQDFLSLSDFDGDILFIVYSIYRMLQKESTQLQGTSIKGITKEDLLSKKICLPEIDEQSAIGSLFRTLDDLLDSYKNNLANYQSLKVTMLSKVFPKAGQTVPEIRLDGFEGEWNKSKLKDVAHRVQGNDGRMDLPTLTISASGGWMNQIDRFSANIAGKEQKNYTLLKKGELSYNHGNSKLAKYGVVFELQAYEEALVPKVYHSFRVNQLADAKFIEIMFSTKIPDRELGKLVSSGARMDGLLNISFDDFMNIAIIIPTIDEQQAIGAYFSNLDNLIASHQEKILQLETLKKKLLQDMFI
ncbi:restriction endonuclease subunit S [Streptococcus gordonii]|uniref:restriction endonuclease subunit S n=1 Tax=Streptococcus gordonii TaxID=1302 RepID=UPI000779AAD7|nr:restriction endonuclease subunit S [Streptococcus gordonii]